MESLDTLILGSPLSQPLSLSLGVCGSLCICALLNLGALLLAYAISASAKAISELNATRLLGESILLTLLAGDDIASNGERRSGGGCVGEESYALDKLSGEPLGVEVYSYRVAPSGCYLLFVPLSGGAVASRPNLVDKEGIVAHILAYEEAGDHSATLPNVPEVVGGLLELYNAILSERDIGGEECRHDCHHECRYYPCRTHDPLPFQIVV